MKAGNFDCTLHLESIKNSKLTDEGDEQNLTFYEYEQELCIN